MRGGGKGYCPVAEKAISKSGGTFVARSHCRRKSYFACGRLTNLQSNEFPDDVISRQNYHVVRRPFFINTMSGFWSFISPSVQLFCQVSVGFFPPLGGSTLKAPVPAIIGILLILTTAAASVLDYRCGKWQLVLCLWSVMPAIVRVCIGITHGPASGP